MSIDIVRKQLQIARAVYVCGIYIFQSVRMLWQLCDECVKRGVCVVLIFSAMLLCSGSAWSLSHPYFSKHPKAAEDLERLLQGAGLQILEYQPADLSLVLSDIEGKDYNLSRHRGQVILLTRWATWCQACTAELPSKLKLHREVGDRRFAVIGISDEKSQQIAAYQRSAKQAYPVSLSDSRGLLQKFFPSSAVPFTILIDAWGWMLAMQRGAGAWDSERHQKLISYLLSIAPSAEQLMSKVPGPDVEYPKTIDAKVGQAFGIVFNMRWIGENDKYSRLAIRLPKEEGLQFLGIETSGILSDYEGNRREYILRLKATKAGTYQLDPVLLNYWLKDYDGHFQSNIGAIALTASAAVSFGNYPEWFLWAILAIIMLIGLTTWVIIRERKKPTEEQITEHQALENKLSQLLIRLEQALTDKDQRNQIEVLHLIYRDILKRESAEISELRDQILYGGHELTTTKSQQLRSEVLMELEELFPKIVESYKHS